MFFLTILQALEACKGYPWGGGASMGRLVLTGFREPVTVLAWWGFIWELRRGVMSEAEIAGALHCQPGGA